MGNLGIFKNIRRRRIGRVSLSIFVSFSVCSTDAAQYTLPGPREQTQALSQVFPQTDGCKISVVTAYDLEGFWYPASVRGCKRVVNGTDIFTVQDVSAGPHAPAPGDQIVWSDGWVWIGSTYSLMRGRPNTAYDIARYVDNKRGVLAYSPAKSATMRDASVILPFMPNSIIQYEHMETPRYAYGDLKILPGRAAEAYPLNTDSIIVAMDGFLFGTPGAFPELLSHGFEGAPYIEVTYAQKNEKPQQLRRAIIPVLPQATRADWNSLAANSHVGEEDRFGHYLALATILAGVLALAYGWEHSGMGDAARKMQERCRRRQLSSPEILC